VAGHRGSDRLRLGGGRHVRHVLRNVLDEFCRHDLEHRIRGHVDHGIRYLVHYGNRCRFDVDQWSINVDQ
jgi:hypothetical protein